MTFVSTPNSGQSLGATRDQMRTNTDLLRSTLAKDHVDVNDTINTPGYHNFVHLIDATGNIPTTAVGQMAIYQKLDANSKPQLFIKRNNNSFEYQLTTISGKNAANNTFAVLLNDYPKSDGSGNAGAAFSAGWTFLPGGLIMQYGFYDAGVTGLASTGIIPFCVPFTGTIFNVSLTMICKVGGTSKVSDLSVISGSATINQFSWNMDSSTSAYTGIYWQAIGVGSTA
jgi:hypothetical protein